MKVKLIPTPIPEPLKATADRLGEKTVALVSRKDFDGFEKGDFEFGPFITPHGGSYMPGLSGDHFAYGVVRVRRDRTKLVYCHLSATAEQLAFGMTFYVTPQCVDALTKCMNSTTVSIHRNPRHIPKNIRDQCGKVCVVILDPATITAPK